MLYSARAYSHCGTAGQSTPKHSPSLWDKSVEDRYLQRILVTDINTSSICFNKIIYSSRSKYLPWARCRASSRAHHSTIDNNDFSVAEGFCPISRQLEPTEDRPTTDRVSLVVVSRRHRPNSSSVRRSADSPTHARTPQSSFLFHRWISPAPPGRKFCATLRTRMRSRWTIVACRRETTEICCFAGEMSGMQSSGPRQMDLITDRHSHESDATHNWVATDRQLFSITKTTDYYH